MRNLIFIAFIFSSIGCALGQESPRTYSRWHIKPASGINIPITNLLSGEITDDLLKYDDQSFYLQFFSGSFWFSQNWGVEFVIQMNISNSIARRGDIFNAQVQDHYGEDYFVTMGYSEMYYDKSLLGNFPKGYLGLVYRIEKQKYIFLPKVFVGITSTYADRGNAHLKEKGAHTILELSYNSEKGMGDHFTIAPGFSFGYRLSKRFIANFDLVYSFYKTDFEFIKETRNVFTEETSSIAIPYKKDIHTLSMGVGLIIELNLGDK